MKQWTDQNFFNKGQQQDIDPTLADNQSFVSLKNGRLIQEGAEDYSIQNLIGDSAVTEAGFGLPGTSNQIQFKLIPNQNLLTTIAVNLTIIDPINGTNELTVTVVNPGDSLTFYKKFTESFLSQAALLGSNISKYKAAYDSQRAVVWLDTGSVITNDNYKTLTINITSGNLTRNNYIGKANAYQPIAYHEFQNEIIVVGLALNGSSTIGPIEGGEFQDDKYPVSVYQDPLDTNVVAIWSFKVNNQGQFTSSKLIYCNYLNYKLDRILDIEGSEENNELIRIYLTDGQNPKRFLNIQDSNIMVLEPRELEVFPEIKFSQPFLKSIDSNGQLPVCQIQYCYTLVAQTGAETVISPVSQLVPIGAYENNQKTKGGEAGAITDKSVTMIIEELDLTFNRIKIYALYSFSGNSIDAVELINEQKLINATLEFTHYAYQRGEQFTYEQLLSTNNGFKYAKHLASSDGRLFVAGTANDIPNLTEWNTLIKQYNASGNTYTNDLNTNPTLFKYLPGIYTNYLGGSAQLIQGGQSDTYNQGNGVRVTFKIKEIPIEDYDGGSLSPPGSTRGVYDPLKEYVEGDIVLYQSIVYIAVGSAVTGAPSPNSSSWNVYSGGINNFIVPNGFSTGLKQKSDAIEYLEYFPENKSPLYHGNQSPNFTSPHFHSRMAAYTPGETYRIGILPRDLQGNPLEVRYIGDLIVPDFKDLYYDFDMLTNKHNYDGIEQKELDFRPFVTRVLFGQKYTYARLVYLDIDVKIPKNILEQISGYEIVRSRITDEDKKAVASGLIHQVMTYDNKGIIYTVNNTNNQGPEGNMNNTYGNSMELTAQNLDLVSESIFTLDSPDNMLGKKTVSDLFNLELVHVQELGYEQTQQGPNYMNTNNYKSIEQYLYMFNAGDVKASNGAVNKNSPLQVFRAVNVLGAELVPKEIIRSVLRNYRNSMMRNFMSSNQSTAGGRNASVAGRNLAIGNPTIVLRLENDTGGLGITSRALVKSLMQLRRKNFSPYGGLTQFSILNTQWISTGHYTKATSNRHIHLVAGGDHYAGIFTHGKAYAQGSWDRPDGNQSVAAISAPTFGNINWNFAHGSRVTDPAYNWNIAEPFLFNDCFAKENNFRVYTTNNDEVPTINYQPYNIAVSPQKINGALIDQWLKFPVFDFYELPSKYGLITALVSVRNALYVVQERGIAILAIDPNALIKGEETDILIGNGTGRVIADHQYICNYGTSYKSSIVKYPDGFVFLDSINQCYVLIQGNQFRLLSEETMNSAQFRDLFGGANNILDKPLIGKGFAGYYDPVYKEIVTTILK